MEERERLQAQRPTVVREEPKGRKDQGVHDSRYRRAVAGGASHWKAWKEEKGRRRAQEHRRSGVGERARERIKADSRWHARHDRKLKDSDFVDNQQEDADIDTEVIDAEGNEAQAESRREFRPLTRAERNSDRVDADDEEELYEKERERKERPKADGRYSADPEVAAEQRKKRNQKRNASWAQRSEEEAWVRMGPGPQEAKQEAAPPGGGRRRGRGLRRLPQPPGR